MITLEEGGWYSVMEMGMVEGRGWVFLSTLPLIKIMEMGMVMVHKQALQNALSP